LCVYAALQDWPEDDWAIYLSALLKGRALEVYSWLSPSLVKPLFQLISPVCKLGLWLDWSSSSSIRLYGSQITVTSLLIGKKEPVDLTLYSDSHFLTAIDMIMQPVQRQTLLTFNTADKAYTMSEFQILFFTEKEIIILQVNLVSLTLRYPRGGMTPNTKATCCSPRGMKLVVQTEFSQLHYIRQENVGKILPLLGMTTFPEIVNGLLL